MKLRTSVLWFDSGSGPEPSRSLVHGELLARLRTHQTRQTEMLMKKRW